MPDKIKKILEVGAGDNPSRPRLNEKIIHLDRIKNKDIEVIHDLDKFPYPFKNEEFDEILCFNILEHVSELIKTMKELNRILKKGGIMKIKVPLFPSMYSVVDPTHKNFFVYNTFDYFQYHAPFLYPEARFRIIKKRIRYSQNKFLNIFSYPINSFPKFYSRYLSGIFPANELYVELEKEK
jgi:predicted SAM-dependent methyltransferase